MLEKITEGRQFPYRLKSVGVSLPKRMAIKFPKLIKYEDPYFRGVIAINNILNGLCGGGIRLNKKTDLNMLIKLAKNMSLKYKLHGIKCGGAKALIIPKNNKFNRKQLRGFIKKFIDDTNKQLSPFIYLGGVDIGISFDDLPVKHYHKSIFFTAYGILMVIKHLAIPKEKLVVLDGTGKVGIQLLKLFIKNNYKIVGVTNKKIKLFNNFKRKDLFRILYLLEKWGDDGLVKFNELSKGKYKVKSILDKRFDIFIPCSYDYILNYTNIKKFKANVVIPTTNLPFDDYSEKKFTSVGGFYVPSFVSGSGAILYNHYKKYLISDNVIKLFFWIKFRNIINQLIKSKSIDKFYATIDSKTVKDSRCWKIRLTLIKYFKGLGIR